MIPEGLGQDDLGVHGPDHPVRLAARGVRESGEDGGQTPRRGWMEWEGVEGGGGKGNFGDLRKALAPPPGGGVPQSTTPHPKRVLRIPSDSCLK